jgi:hypothetical protein
MVAPWVTFTSIKQRVPMAAGQRPGIQQTNPWHEEWEKGEPSAERFPILSLDSAHLRRTPLLHTTTRSQSYTFC